MNLFIYELLWPPKQWWHISLMIPFFLKIQSPTYYRTQAGVTHTYTQTCERERENCHPFTLYYILYVMQAHLLWKNVWPTLLYAALEVKLQLVFHCLQLVKATEIFISTWNSNSSTRGGLFNYQCLVMWNQPGRVPCEQCNMPFLYI